MMSYWWVVFNVFQVLGRCFLTVMQVHFQFLSQALQKVQPVAQSCLAEALAQAQERRTNARSQGTGPGPLTELEEASRSWKGAAEVCRGATYPPGAPRVSWSGCWGNGGWCLGGEKPCLFYIPEKCRWLQISPSHNFLFPLNKACVYGPVVPCYTTILKSQLLEWRMEAILWGERANPKANQSLWPILSFVMYSEPEWRIVTRLIC